MAHLRVTPLSCLVSIHFSCFPFFVLSQKFVFLFFFFLVFLSNLSNCWHESQSSTLDVSCVVGAPWRCGVLTTQGGIAGIGLGHLRGREHDPTPQSGVEALQIVLLLLFWTRAEECDENVNTELPTNLMQTCRVTRE